MGGECAGVKAAMDIEDVGVELVITVEVVFIVSSGDVDVTVLALVGGEEVAVTAIVSRATREVEVESDIDERLDDSDVDVAIAGTGVDDEVAFAQ